MKPFRWIAGFLVLACSLPLFSLLPRAALAKLLGCALSEADVQPCSILGVSIGPLLYTLSTAAWLMILTLPLGAVVLVAWIGSGSVGFVHKRVERYSWK